MSGYSALASPTAVIHRCPIPLWGALNKHLPFKLDDKILVMYVTCCIIWHMSKKSLFEPIGNQWNELCWCSEHRADEIQVSASIVAEDYFSSPEPLRGVREMSGHPSL